MQLIGKAPHVGFMTRQELERMIIEAGFEVLEAGDYPANSANHFVAARRL
ncbi:hypothetical protein G5B38_04030 [Pseudohalocynthiibacter aestuariivivens]|nr:hypothetical protein [Pseudohalocynthiibacter aestuariivivens]QIE44762.1 hypothetical protein G5B38_04030 [Pseudohalocynthiibacter aestuariivivens]